MLPFGVTDALVMFMTLSNFVLEEYVNKFVEVFLDDNLV